MKNCQKYQSKAKNSVVLKHEEKNGHPVDGLLDNHVFCVECWFDIVTVSTKRAIDI